ncbi:MAG: ATP-binding protein [Planctomycetaceae bacterium]
MNNPDDTPARRRPKGPPASIPPTGDDDVDAILRDPATLWETAWRTSGEYIAIVDRACIIRACNRVDDGFGIDQVVGHSIVRFTLPDSSAALEAMVHEVFADGEMRTLETVVRRLDGQLSYFALRISPLRRQGQIAAVMVCCENIRPLRNTERALAREQTVLRRLIEIQERERQLVSYEIHDGLAQYIAGAIMHFEAHLHDLQGRASREAVDGMRLLRAAAEESRRLIGGLRPPSLDELGIVDAIDSLVADARIEIPDVEFVHHLPGERLPLPLETVIFRIVQESLTNARRYAEASRAEVRLERTADGILVSVRDDGRGFDVEAVPDSHFGLEGIRQRCRMFGAAPRIASSPGAGTTIEVVLPLSPPTTSG